MNELKIFDSEEFGAIRTVLIDDEPWFVGRDVAAALGYANPRDAVSRHVDDEDKGVAKHDTLGGQQELSIINESGLYSLIFSSQLESAKRFKHWVTSEVLPAIRKSGTYAVVERNEYDAKSTSVGEVVNLLRLIRSSMKERMCRPDDIALTIDSVCSQFGISLPQSFLANPVLVTECEGVSNEELQEFACQLMENAHQIARGLVVTSEEFGKFCGRKGIDSRQYRKWLLWNGYIVPSPDGKSSVVVRLGNRAMRCVVFKRDVIG